MKYILVPLILALAGPGVALPAAAAQPPGLQGYAAETRNRAAVLVVGDPLSPAVVRRLQEQWTDVAAFFHPSRPVPEVAAAERGLDSWLEARTWHGVVLALAPVGTDSGERVQRLRALMRKLQDRQLAVITCTWPGRGEEGETARANDAIRQAARAEEVEIADLRGVALANPGTWPGATGEWTEEGARRVAEALREPVRRALFKRSTPWAVLPPGEKRDPANLLAEDAALASPMSLPEAPGETATVYRAEAGAWQFNLHSFIAHHEGHFWAAWSSGRVDEDSSSQLIRYATSRDGRLWSEARVLADDPDGEAGPWRWMTSGLYVEDGKLYALGSKNQGNNPPGGPWSHAELIRFVWTGTGWREDRKVADNCVVYFPPLRIAGRDFFVWRDSRAWFYTGLAPAGTNDWEVRRVPGPMPDYRMSETSAYVDPAGVVHLIIRDQGYTRRLYHSLSYDGGGTWTIPVKTNYPDAVSKNLSGRLSNGWYYLISNPKAAGANPRDPLVITFSRDGWSFGHPLALRKNAPALRYKGGAKGSHSFQYTHAIEQGGKLWVIYATNKEDIEVSAYPLAGFGLPP
ncbi:MAG: exo-alpha-sialidase [Verrucomicrobia bacterium]|nr:exo-alpha-sialidase [Verrucomicrobiota bacterium]